ncbi:MAG: NAD-dependent epimerase/dehydratase family protein [Lentisphaerae bacterium]|nr:NAD-dependent epimerase/dehydratase family protein [Lentisphaerota bacterium]
MRILITGGAGFIGSNIAQYYQDRAEVRVLDNLRSGRGENLKDLNVEFIRGDVRDRVKLAKAMKNVDYVFHLAAMIGVPESMQKPQECIDINVNGTLMVLEEAAKAGVKKLCYASSAAVYGNACNQVRREDMCADPDSIYAVTKLDGEHYCKIFSENNKLKTVSLRYFNVFGPRQDPDSAYAAAPALFCNRAIHGKKISIFGDGEQSRDFVYIDDVVKVNAFFMENDLEGVYNVATGNTVTINDLVSRILFMTDSQSEVEHLPERPGDIKHLQASTDKLHSAGIKCSSPFTAGLGETINYYNTNS